MKKYLKKIIAIVVVGGTFTGYVISQKTSSDNPVGSNSVSSATADNASQSVIALNLSDTPKPVAVAKPVPKPKPVAAPTPKPVTTPAPKPVPAPVPAPLPAPAPKPVGAFKDGIYTGDVVDAYYGNIQVQAVVQNGALVDVIFLQHPSDRNTSIMINNRAMPQLKSEAIMTQSANVDTVSGASASSQAFSQSLQSALSQAKV
jgi:uncharacterized protein with FMN-binding domain